MNTEAFIKYYQLIFGDDPQPREACEYIIKRSNNFWKTTVMYHSFLSSNAFNVFDGNHDGVIDFAEYLFMLACDCNSNLVLKYGYLFEM